MWLNKSKIEASYKSSDTEEFLDRVFYRKLGYLLALLAKKIGLSPNNVTFLSALSGVIAGHFFYYNDISLNIIGVLLLIFGEVLDGADGQLARMTNNFSRYGRIFDGLATNLAFVSIYLHICFRLMNEGWSYSIFLIAVIAGLSHSFQSAMADYYRSFYFYFVYGKKNDIDDINEVIDTYKGLNWFSSPFKKFLLRVYINYIRQQSLLAKNVKNLFSLVRDKFNNTTPEDLKNAYRHKNKPMVKYQNILTTNTRMIFLFIMLFIPKLEFYFYFEIIVLNMLLIYFLIKEESIHKKIYLEFKRGIDAT